MAPGLNIRVNFFGRWRLLKAQESLLIMVNFVAHVPVIVINTLLGLTNLILITNL